MPFLRERRFTRPDFGSRKRDKVIHFSPTFYDIIYEPPAQSTYADNQCDTRASGNWENTHLFSDESSRAIFVHAKCVSGKWRWSLPSFVIMEKEKTYPLYICGAVASRERRKYLCSVFHKDFHSGRKSRLHGLIAQPQVCVTNDTKHMKL